MIDKEHKFCIGKNDHSWEVGYDKGYQQGRADTIDECKSLFADWFGYNYQNQGFYRLLEQLKEQKMKTNDAIVSELLEKNGEAGFDTKDLFDAMNEARADERAKHRYLIKEDGSIHNLDEDIENARINAINDYTEWLNKIHANFDEDYAEDIKNEYLIWLKEKNK